MTSKALPSSSPLRSLFLRRRALLGLLTVISAVAPLHAADAPSGKKYLRFVDEADGTRQLQTSIVHFQNAEGVKVDLVGAVHIADRPYFSALNRRFIGYDAVLYEMVKPKDMQGVHREGRPASWVSMLQRFMQDQLELDFQLDRVDYEPKNFVHADLDAETFVERQAARGESMLTLMMNTMMRELNKPAEARSGSAASMGIMDLVEALQSPDRARQLKLVLARQFEDMDDALEAMGGPNGSVILDERNKHALSVLKTEIDGGKKNVAIFYGAAHLKGMEELMTGLMGFKQVGEPEWLVAWDLADKAGATTKPTTKTNPTTKPAE